MVFRPAGLGETGRPCDSTALQILSSDYSWMSAVITAIEGCVSKTPVGGQSAWMRPAGLGLCPQAPDQPSLLLDVLDCLLSGGFVEVARVASECGPFNPRQVPFGPFDQTAFKCTALEQLECVSLLLDQ
jgi:hypothetical protein